MIDGHLTEINVTSPTGIRAIQRLGGPDLSVAVWDAIEAGSRRARAFERYVSAFGVALSSAQSNSSSSRK